MCRGQGRFLKNSACSFRMYPRKPATKKEGFFLCQTFLALRQNGPLLSTLISNQHPSRRPQLSSNGCFFYSQIQQHSFIAHSVGSLNGSPPHQLLSWPWKQTHAGITALFLIHSETLRVDGPLDVDST